MAELLLAHPEWIARSSLRIARWEAQGALHPEYAARWQVWLEMPLHKLCDRIVALDEEAQDMRQTSPLTCNLQAKERWAILKRFYSPGVTQKITAARIAPLAATAQS